jgi:hypothetical protein
MADKTFGEDTAREVETKRQKKSHQCPDEIRSSIPSLKSGIRILKRKEALTFISS